MTISRIKKMVLATLLFTGLIGHAFAKEGVFQAADGVYAYSSHHGINSMFVITEEGVAIFDSANSDHAKGLLNAIRDITDRPIRYVIQSHNHWDHASGGQVFLDEGATIIAHAEAYEWMKGNPHPDLALPNDVWAGKRKTLTLGDKTIEFYYLGMSHGLGMTAFVLPEEKVAYVADLVTPNRVMFTIVPDFNINEWKRALTEIEQLNFDKAIFSHSHAETPIGTMDDVVLSREFIEDLQSAVMTEFKNGTPFESIPAKVKLEKYKHWVGYNEWLHMNVLRIMLDMYMGPFPWRPTQSYE